MKTRHRHVIEDPSLWSVSTRSLKALSNKQISTNIIYRILLRALSTMNGKFSMFILSGDNASNARVHLTFFGLIVQKKLQITEIFTEAAVRVTYPCCAKPLAQLIAGVWTMDTVGEVVETISATIRSEEVILPPLRDLFNKLKEATFSIGISNIFYCIMDKSVLKFRHYTENLKNFVFFILCHLFSLFTEKRVLIETCSLN